jgi:hypothetical protein
MYVHVGVETNNPVTAVHIQAQQDLPIGGFAFSILPREVS